MFNFAKSLEEMHILAYIYHWERDTLWKLSSRERRMWVKMIMTQKRMENDSIKGKTSKLPKPNGRT